MSLDHNQLYIIQMNSFWGGMNIYKALFEEINSKEANYLGIFIETKIKEKLPVFLIS